MIILKARITERTNEDTIYKDVEIEIDDLEFAKEIERIINSRILSLFCSHQSMEVFADTEKRK